MHDMYKSRCESIPACPGISCIAHWPRGERGGVAQMRVCSHRRVRIATSCCGRRGNDRAPQCFCSGWCERSCSGMCSKLTAPNMIHRTISSPNIRRPGLVSVMLLRAVAANVITRQSALRRQSCRWRLWQITLLSLRLSAIRTLRTPSSSPLCFCFPSSKV